MKPTYADMAVQLANAESKCRELAAENTGLNKFIAKSCFVQAGEVPSWHQAIDHAPETQATDAFLAEVRAQGVESAGEYLKQYAQGLHEEARLVLQDAGELCNGFAAQLRKGAAL